MGHFSHKNEKLLFLIVFCKQNLHASYFLLIVACACMTLAFSLLPGYLDVYELRFLYKLNVVTPELLGTLLMGPGL